jgi:hypothetical protein
MASSSSLLKSCRVSKATADCCLDLYRVTEAWEEGTGDGSYQPGCASWLVCSGDAGGEIEWTAPGGTHDEELLGRSLIPNAAHDPGFDITSLVQAWASGMTENLGVILKKDSPTITGIKASEYSEYGRPYLEITYTYPSDASPRADSDGRERGRVATLIDGPVSAGLHGVTWRGVDDRGAALDAGVSFARLRSGGAGETRKILLAR